MGEAIQMGFERERVYLYMYWDHFEGSLGRNRRGDATGLQIGVFGAHYLCHVSDFPSIFLCVC